MGRTLRERGWNGEPKKRFFFYCEVCDKFVSFRDYSVRWNTRKRRRCDCKAVVRPCTPAEGRKASKVFPGKKKKKARKPKGWYAEYLSSELWATIRLRVLTRDKDVCRRCQGKATQVHHRSYEQKVMDGLDDGPLVSLCHDCHHWIEFDGKRKVSLKEANARLDGFVV